MKRILLCLMMYGSCANAALVRFGPFEGGPEFQAMRWFLLNTLFRQRLAPGAFFVPDVPRPILPIQPLNEEEIGQDPEMRRLLEKEVRRAQKLEARESAKRAWLQSRHHDKPLPKKNKWVYQQSRARNN